jgi:hypothetical protein
MNTTKVLIGGVVAGAVFFLSDVGFQLLFGGRLAEDMTMAGLSELPMTLGTVVTSIVINMVLGLMLVWLYAALRPRFGPGMQTATRAAVFVWLLACLMLTGWLLTGVFSTVTFVLMVAWYLPFSLAAAWAGGRIYTEPATVPAAVAA